MNDPYGTKAAAEELLAGHAVQKANAARWCEYCRMMAEHDNEAIEAFGSMIPPGVITKEFLDLAMDAWLAQKRESKSTS